MQVYKAKDINTGALVALKKTRLEVSSLSRLSRLFPPHCSLLAQMEEEGVPSTTLREVSLLLMLSESNHIVKCVRIRIDSCVWIRSTNYLTMRLYYFRLMSVEHAEENNKPCLYLVGSITSL